MGRGLSVSLEGDDLNKILSDMSTKVRDAVEQAVGDETVQVGQDMHDTVPVDEGELQDSIVTAHDGLEGSAEAQARHAGFVEHGTSNTPAQPFALPAAEQARSRFVDRVSDAVAKETS